MIAPPHHDGYSRDSATIELSSVLAPIHQKWCIDHNNDDYNQSSVLDECLGAAPHDIGRR
jgi:hypothetical protein